MSAIPLFSAQKANDGLDFKSAIDSVLNRYWYVMGEEVKGFEAEFAKYVNVDHCISVANGSDALELALKALGVDSQSKVVTVANAGFYGSTAIHAVGATPVYVDVDESSLTICPIAMREALALRPAAVIVTHLYGQLADIIEIVRIANEAGIPVLEDCAQSHGARRLGQQAGSFGNIACFSFYPTKNLGALGDGGAVVTNNSVLAANVRQLRQYGWSTKYTVAVPGGRNSRLDEIQAAILRVKLPHLDSWNSQRRSIAARYNAAFSNFPMQTPHSTGEDYVGHLYVVRVDERQKFATFLKEHEITTDIHYPISDHQQPAYRAAASLPITEKACDQVISLPCFPGLSDEEVDRVIAAVTKYFS